SFTAAVNGGGVELTWETATETNNRGFEIERISDYLESVLSERSETKDGNQWQRIGFIEGHHTTNTPQEYSFTDNAARGILRYRLKQIDRDGKFAYSPIVEVKIAAPAVFALSQNYPNPFNPSTTISFTLQHTGLTTLKVYDAIGREVATLVNEVLEAGVYHQKQFNAGNLASGVYFARLTSGAQTQMKKLLLMK
ncbi:MAG: T9SS type A sorting domain-containing protein, partial [Bacteroidetes bacterium]|nr:T9SS type A sorting domain-containing protein [Bacteroidota bacterium]